MRSVPVCLSWFLLAICLSVEIADTASLRNVEGEIGEEIPISRRGTSTFVYIAIATVLLVSVTAVSLCTWCTQNGDSNKSLSVKPNDTAAEQQLSSLTIDQYEPDGAPKSRESPAAPQNLDAAHLAASAGPGAQKTAAVGKKAEPAPPHEQVVPKTVFRIQEAFPQTATPSDVTTADLFGVAVDVAGPTESEKRRKKKKGKSSKRKKKSKRNKVEGEDGMELMKGKDEEQALSPKDMENMMSPTQTFQDHASSVTIDQ